MNLIFFHQKQLRILALLLFLLALTACGKQSSSGKEASLSGLTEKVALEDYWELPLSESESGYYYNRGSESSPLGIHYVDKSTGKDILLCNKPECRHDGNEFCVATNKKYAPFAMQFYDKALYVGAICMGENTFEIKLIKIAPDGSSLSEVATIFQSNLASSSDPTVSYLQDKMILHRGKAIFHVRIDGEAQMEDTVAYGTAIYDVNDGSISYLDTEPISTENPPLENLSVRGDDFYYVITEGKKHVLHKHNLTDGNDESLELLPNFTGEYVVTNNGNVFYLRSLKKALYLRHLDGKNEEISDLAMYLHESTCLDPDSVRKGIPLELIPAKAENLSPSIAPNSLDTDGEHVYVRYNVLTCFTEMVDLELPEELEYLRTDEPDENGKFILIHWEDPDRLPQTEVTYFNLTNYLCYSVFDAEGHKQKDLEVPVPIKDSQGQPIDPALLSFRGSGKHSYDCILSPYLTQGKIFLRVVQYEIYADENVSKDPKIFYVEESIEDFLAEKPFPDPVYVPSTETN